ncbi:MAG: hypothetical protein AAB214_04915 [Fibrobacterota bacterium]
MAGGSITITGNQALAIHDLLGKSAKLSARDIMLMGKMRGRIRRILKTDEDGSHRAMEYSRKVLRYSISDVASGISPKLVGEPIERQDGSPIEIFIYSSEERAKSVGEFIFDESEKATLYRLFLDKLSDKATSGSEADTLYRQAGWFPSIQKALEATMKALHKDDPFEEPPPDELDTADSE